MQSKTGCPELVFEILKSTNLTNFRKKMAKIKPRRKKKFISQKRINVWMWFFSGHIIEALFSINNIDCLKKSKLISKFIILFIKSTENCAQMTTNKEFVATFQKVLTIKFLLKFVKSMIFTCSLENRKKNDKGFALSKFKRCMVLQ